MAISTVNQMVKDRVPFLDNVSFDALIERKRVEVVYIMQKQSGKLDADVELESNYTPIQNILFSAMIAWYQIKSKALQTAAGDGSAGSTGSGKVLKRAKADVTEAEFMLAKAEDGSFIQIKTTDYLDSLKEEICNLSMAIGWANPICIMVFDMIPAFIIGDDFPPNHNSWCADFPNGVFPPI